MVNHKVPAALFNGIRMLCKNTSIPSGMFQFLLLGVMQT